MLKSILLQSLTLFVIAVSAQTQLPLIRANSKKISIRDGGFLDKDAWNLSPKARPDIYTADRTRQTKWVTFYSDIDSIRVKLKPGSSVDFVVLLNGKDSCFTRVQSAVPAAIPLAATKADTIPFTLSPNNAIAITAHVNDTASYQLHFDLSAFDICFTSDALKQRIPKADINKLTVGTLTWPHPQIRTTSLTSRGMEGRLGWNLFENRIVEVNYDNHLMIISSALPGLKGYQKFKLDFIRSFPCIKATVQTKNKPVTGEFLFDTGAELALIMDSSWAANSDFANGLPVISTRTLRDPRGHAYETKTVMAPAISLKHFRLANTPALILAGQNPTGIAINYFGNDLLKRFNLIFDFKNDAVYMRPNQLFGTAFQKG